MPNEVWGFCICCRFFLVFFFEIYFSRTLLLLFFHPSQLSCPSTLSQSLFSSLTHNTRCPWLNGGKVYFVLQFLEVSVPSWPASKKQQSGRGKLLLSWWPGSRKSQRQSQEGTYTLLGHSCSDLPLLSRPQHQPLNLVIFSSQSSSSECMRVQEDIQIQTVMSIYLKWQMITLNFILGGRLLSY